MFYNLKNLFNDLFQFKIRFTIHSAINFSFYFLVKVVLSYLHLSICCKFINFHNLKKVPLQNLIYYLLQESKPKLLINLIFYNDINKDELIYYY